MAPLSQSKETRLIETREGGTKVYALEKLDKNWAIISLPYGGYIVCLILNAALQSQKGSSTPDPYHASFCFLRPTTWASVEVHVKETRKGGGTTNLLVEMYQEGKLKATGTMIFGNFDAQKGPSAPQTHMPLCPFELHPSESPVAPKHKFIRFEDQISASGDVQSLSRNSGLFEEGRTVRGPEWNAWIELKEEGDKGIEADMLGPYIDSSVPLLASLKQDMDYPAWFTHWYATLTMNIEFKVKFPLDGGKVHPWTLGHWAKQRHITNGKYSDVIELWSAPCGTSRDQKVGTNWRDEMVCVAQGYTMGIAIPATELLPKKQTKAKSKTQTQARL